MKLKGRCLSILRGFLSNSRGVSSSSEILYSSEATWARGLIVCDNGGPRRGWRPVEIRINDAQEFSALSFFPCQSSAFVKYLTNRSTLTKRSRQLKSTFRAMFYLKSTFELGGERVDRTGKGTTEEGREKRAKNSHGQR